MLKSWFIGLAMALAVAVPVARAALVGDATVPYTATRTVTIDNKTYVGRVFHVPGKQRHDVDINGIEMGFIIDLDRSVGIVMVPSLTTYVEFPFPALLSELDTRRLGGKAVGEEKIDGQRATKYRVDYTVSDGARGEGFLWVSKDNILLKLEGRVTRPNHRPTQLRMELSDLAFDPPGPEEFSIPKGLHKLPPEALEALLNLNLKLKKGGN
jgi:hypothetical protein